MVWSTPPVARMVDWSLYEIAWMRSGWRGGRRVKGGESMVVVAVVGLNCAKRCCGWRCGAKVCRLLNASGIRKYFVVLDYLELKQALY